MFWSPCSSEFVSVPSSSSLLQCRTASSASPRGIKNSSADWKVFLFFFFPPARTLKRKQSLQRCDSAKLEQFLQPQLSSQWSTSVKVNIMRAAGHVEMKQTESSQVQFSWQLVPLTMSKLPARLWPMWLILTVQWVLHSDKGSKVSKAHCVGKAHTCRKCTEKWPILLRTHLLIEYHKLHVYHLKHRQSIKHTVHTLSSNKSYWNLLLEQAVMLSDKQPHAAEYTLRKSEFEVI